MRTIPVTEALKLRREFQDTITSYLDEFENFIGNESRVAVYGFEDDPASGEYAAYLKWLFPGRAHAYTINLSRQPNGGIEDSDVAGKKVLVCSDLFEGSYAEFLGRRFGELDDGGVITLENVRYVTARPYKMRRIERSVDSNGDKENTGKTFSAISL